MKVLLGFVPTIRARAPSTIQQRLDGRSVARAELQISQQQAGAERKRAGRRLRLVGQGLQNLLGLVDVPIYGQQQGVIELHGAGIVSLLLGAPAGFARLCPVLLGRLEIQQQAVAGFVQQLLSFRCCQELKCRMGLAGTHVRLGELLDQFRSRTIL